MYACFRTSNSSSMSMPSRGRLTIFLGYAAGVGKTYKMLEEAHALKARGVDIVIGYFEPHGRTDTIALAEGLELIPRKIIEYRGVRLQEMDTEAILKRHPQVCAVDEFPHTNVPGSERAKRWEDVEVLLDAGIDVLTTMNVQHLESLNDQVWHVSGVRVRETIPDWVVRQADEIVMVDLTPRALLNRLERGVVYAPEKAQRALENFFKESTLVALRELALRQTAHEVETRQPTPASASIVSSNGDAQQIATAAQTASAEKILVHVTADPATAMLIRRAKRVADYLHADCFAVYVHEPKQKPSAAEQDGAAIERHLNFARNLHIETASLEGSDLAHTLVEFARDKGVTQIFLARPRQAQRRRLFNRPLLYEIVRLSHDMQVTIVAGQRQTG